MIPFSLSTALTRLPVLSNAWICQRIKVKKKKKKDQRWWHIWGKRSRGETVATTWGWRTFKPHNVSSYMLAVWGQLRRDKSQMHPEAKAGQVSTILKWMGRCSECVLGKKHVGRYYTLFNQTQRAKTEVRFLLWMQFGARVSDSLDHDMLLKHLAPCRGVFDELPQFSMFQWINQVTCADRLPRWSRVRFTELKEPN